MISISVCHGRSCQERGSPYVLRRLVRDSETLYPDEEITVSTCLCRGRCEKWPTIIVDDHEELSINPIRASDLLRDRIASIKAKRKA